MSEGLTKKEEKERVKEEKKEKLGLNQKKKKKALWIKIAAGVGIPMMVIVGIFIYWGRTPEAAAVADTGAADPMWGPEHAPVVIRVYGDFECPACAAADLFLMEAVENRTDVSVVFNDFPLVLIHPTAKNAAIVAECAYRTGGNDLYWRVHNAFYAQQAEWSASAVAKTKLIEIAVAQGGDQAELEVCYEEEGARSAVNGDQQEARELKLNSTPTFFINDERVVGGMYKDQWIKKIDEALERIETNE